MATLTGQIDRETSVVVIGGGSGLAVLLRGLKHLVERAEQTLGG